MHIFYHSTFAFLLELGQWPFWSLLFVIGIGVFCLWKGADWLTNGAGNLALIHKINPIVIGLTILAIATSIPEFITALISAFQNNSDLIMGNIVGSNICNIGLILGISVILSPVNIQNRLMKIEMPFLLGVTILFSFFALGDIGHIEGILMAFILLGYLIFTTQKAKKEPIVEKEEVLAEIDSTLKSTRSCLLFILLGTLVLALGAELLVDSAVEVATRLKVNSIIIGLTLVAIGTSLPELAASVVAANKKQNDLCIGNIIGSNLFNLLFVGGSIASLFSLGVDKSLFYVEVPAMFLITIILGIMAFTGRIVTRVEGVVLLLIYILIIGLSGYSQLVGF